jgi:putative phosphoribosyl transferase
MPFLDRGDAGRRLAEQLRKYSDRPDCLVLGLPRGGVPVAYEVAYTLHLPLDVFLVRKLGVPGHEELAMGAIASGGVKVLNGDVVGPLHISPQAIEVIARRERREMERREREYRNGRPAPDVTNRTIILIDDGLATGASMTAAVLALRKSRAGRIIVAVPVAAPRACSELGEFADEIVCIETPEDFTAVGEWYYDFFQITDLQVRELLSKAAAEQAPLPAGERG